jgi:hemerythrin-like domain-containing protein
MNCTEELVEEHKPIKTMLWVLSEICSKLEAREQVEPEKLEKMVEFIRMFADKCHHGKEEDVLFPVMSELHDPVADKLVSILLKEHVKGRSYVAKMAKSIESYKNGRDASTKTIAKNGRSYVTLLTGHIPKEDNVTFPLANAMVSEIKQKKILEDYKRIEKERIGEGGHERLLGILEELKCVYCH